MRLIPILTILLLLFNCKNSSHQVNTKTADVIIYGGTSAAVIAAVQLTKMGKSVMIVCPEVHLGGLSSGGLGFTDTGNKEVIGGLAREFYSRIWNYYQMPETWRWQQPFEYGNKGQGTVAMDGERRTMWIFEPHVAEQVFEDMLIEFKIPVFRNEWLDREAGLIKKNNQIKSITTLSGAVYEGQIFIDATYEGDLMAAAGITFHVGRESRSVYNEQWNGVQTEVFHHGHYMKNAIDPYLVPGDTSSGVLPKISTEPPGEKYSGDHRIQAYCYRLCLSDHPDNRIPFAKPDNYDPFQYELLARIFDSGWREVFHKFDAIPNRKTDTNNHGPFSTDNIGMNYDYPEATYERRMEILKEHENYQKGLLYYLANDEHVPVEVRTEMARWGLAADEFTDNGHWPHQIYVREARRMIGQSVMTEHEILGNRAVPQPIGMGSYTMDSHNVQRYITAEGFAQNEGDIGVHPEKPYQIDLGSILPKANECANLLVPVCVSSSHIAYGSIRMEPVFMILGQSAGTLAGLSLEKGQKLHEVPYPELGDFLEKDGQILSLKQE